MKHLSEKSESKRHSTKVRWEEVYNVLKDDILSGKFLSGAKLPNEHQIASDFHVSRLTARRALGELQREGRIRIEQGRGTFVAEKVIDYKISDSMTFVQNLLDSHRSPYRRMLEGKIIRASKEVAEALKIPVSEEVVRITLLGLADNAPISLGQNYIPYSRFPKIIELFKRFRSFNKSFAEYGVLAPIRFETFLTARMPNKREARLLKQPQTAPVVETFGIDIDKADESIISCSFTCFSPSRVKFSVSQRKSG